MAPIGTPPQRQILETAQYLAAVYGWGPLSVLKHNQAPSRSKMAARVARG